MTDAPQTGSKLVNNVALILISRLAMLIATGVGLPTAYWMMNRAVGSVDSIAAKIDTMRDQAFETNGTLKLIEQAQSSQNRVIADHEARVRKLEDLNRGGLSRN